MPQRDRENVNVHFGACQFHLTHWRGDAPDAASPELFCLHGFTGDGLDFELLADQMPHTSMLAIDLLGHGESSAPAHPGPYRAEPAIHALDAALRTSAHLPVDLLGYSMGGRLALWLALTHPEHVRALILVSASPGIEDETQRQARRDSDEELASFIESHGVGAFMERWQQTPLIATQQQIPAEYLARMQARRATRQAVGLSHSLRGFGAGVMPSLWDELHRITAPTLILSGERDEKYSHLGDEMARRMPRARHVNIAEGGHAIHLEKAPQVIEEIEGFLSDLPA